MIKNKSQQQGFTLVAVLATTIIASTVVLTSLNDTTVQERLSGNMEENINARMAAEQGIYDVMTGMKDDVTVSSLDDFLTEQFVNGKATLSSANITIKYSGEGSEVPTDGSNTYEIDSSLEDNEISVTSISADGKSTVTAIYIVDFDSDDGTSSETPFPYANGLTACEAVLVTGSGRIDSYNSYNGDYNSSSASSNAVVRTLYEGADIDINGAAEIEGSINATGNIIFGGSGNVSGSADANGNIDAESAWGQTFDGNVIAQGYVSLRGGSVGGYVLAKGDVTLNQVEVEGSVTSHANYTQSSNVVNGGVTVDGDVTVNWGNSNPFANNDLRYTGTGSFPGNYSYYKNSPYKTSSLNIQSVPEVPYDDSETETSAEYKCDPYVIVDVIEKVEEKSSSAEDLSVTGSDSGDQYLLKQSSAAFTLREGGRNSDLEAITAVPNVPFFEDSFDVLMYENVTINGHLSVSEGQNVTMYVGGNFTMGGAGSLTIPNNSSLTLIVKGYINIAGSAKLYQSAYGLSSDNLPTFSIYSACDDDCNDSATADSGIYFGGGTDDIYAAIYAPVTDTTIASNISFKGSIHANTINVIGDGDVHYDEALADAGGSLLGGESTSTLKFIFKGWEY